MNSTHNSLSTFRRLLLIVNFSLCVSFLVLCCLFVDPNVPLVDVESELSRRYPMAKADAFEHLNRFAQTPFIILAEIWIGTGVAYIIARQYGPLVALVTVHTPMGILY
jgi:hypothetical protein